jgi:hypothetical protein
MSISITPPPRPAPPQKRGLGCLGCGCLVLALLVLLFLALVGGGTYLAYTKIFDLTSPTPPVIPSFAGSDDLYERARQKLAEFDHDVKNHQAAKVQFSGDELNVLIERDPDVLQNHIHVLVTLTDNQCRVQSSLPTDVLSHGLMNGRYFSLDTTFEVHFDQSTKTVDIIPHTLQFGDKVLAGPTAAADDRTAQAFMRSFTPTFNQAFNQSIRKNPDGAALLDQAKSIEIQNGELVIETQ